MPKHSGFLGTITTEFEKNRNDHDSQVEKCKKQIDRINELAGNKIFTYDRETAYVAVPRYDGLTENFQWKWLTSTTGSHKEIIPMFKQILNALEASKDRVLYENLVSNLDASTKNALDVNIKKHNITVPTQQISQEELVEKALSEAERGTKVNNVTAEFKDHFSKLDPDGVVEFMHRTKGTRINVDGCVGTAFLDNALNIKYPTTWKGVSTQKFFIENGITNPYASFENRIDQTVQDTAKIEIFNKKEHSDLESDAESDIEVISQLLESEVTLTNGKKIDVKKIIDVIYKPKELDFYLKKLIPEINQLVKKEIALKLAYDLFNDTKGLSEVSSISETLGINEEFNTYSDFSLAELKDEEVNITGGEYSYLE